MRLFGAVAVLVLATGGCGALADTRTEAHGTASHGIAAQKAAPPADAPDDASDDSRADGPADTSADASGYGSGDARAANPWRKEPGETNPGWQGGTRGFPMLPEDRITFAQMTDNRRVDTSRTASEVGFVWGGSAPHGRAIGSFYYPMDRDLDRSHTADWYAANAPDRIVYKCDRTTPAPLFTYAWGAYAPIDTTNPAVRDYILERYIAPALRSGHKVIALDNVSLRNGGRRCGVYRNGQWVQLFSGEGKDPVYEQAVMDWVKWLADAIHARGGLLALNASVVPEDAAKTRRLIALGDIWLEEAGTSRGCTQRVSDDVWRAKFEAARWAAQRMAWVALEKTCTFPDDIGDDEAQWIVGNFLLARGPQSYLGAVKNGVRIPELHYPPNLNPRVGAPAGPAEEVPGGGWVRPFRRGLVLVNPSSTATMRYRLTDGQWAALDEQPVSGEVLVPPTSARILLRLDLDRR